ncbi:hypothetical protein [Cerasicoccus fimbriatus]|uniref:hypothetical protein n=1 Tax=Cerasicoccus fimbriatus TaxID=3014554 RepID=UPI0022B4243B|nr:hypothetical protein [Cerasicoccus sp. TK19100]
MDPKRIGWWLGLILAIGMTWYLSRSEEVLTEPPIVVPELPTEPPSVENETEPSPVAEKGGLYRAPLNPVAARLNAPDLSAQDDVANVHQLLVQMFGVWKSQRRPMSLNAEFTQALTGDNPSRLAFVPPNHPAIIDGELTDRWGQPYYFHQLSLDRIEVRSAGPDQRLYTEDDALYSPWKSTPDPVASSP